MVLDGNFEDEKLLQGIKNNDKKAFDNLFRKYYPMLCAYAKRFVSITDAEEIVQDTMLWIYEHRNESIIHTSLSQYLFRMTYHRCLNCIAQREIHKKIENAYYNHQPLFDNFNYYQIKDLMQHIEKAVNELPEKYREAFILHRFKGLSYKEIAELYQVSTKTVDYRILQALKYLRISLKDYIEILIFLFSTKF